MHPHPVHLPTEVLILIVSFAASDKNECRRQSTLYACCLVSHQWYSAAVAFLYKRPRLYRGRAFQKFTNTVCPPIAARKSKLNLGYLVRRLDLSGLVHHSSNSLTARLLGRTRENLEVFIAPSVSFAVNSLPALSKCYNLRHLDLSLVSDSLPFSNLKKALSHLPKLLSLRLPRTTSITDSTLESDLLPWPPLLHRLQLAGSFSDLTISSVSWPPRLTSLILRNCPDLSVNKLGSLLSSPHLARSLSRLTISGSNRKLQPQSIAAVPSFLPDLTFLSVPGDLVDESFFDMLSLKSASPLALELLEFGTPHYESRLYFSTSSLMTALDGALANLRAVGFADAFLTEQRILEDEEVDDFLQKRVKEREARRRRVGLAGHDDSDAVSDDEDDSDVGVYYL